MRAIKFRLWDNHNNKYFEPTYEAYAGRLEYVVMNQSGDLDMVTMKGIAHESTFKDRFVVELFAGLLDKNGVEIYEGDICQAEKANSYLKGKYQVVWDSDKGRWCYDGSSLIRKYQVGSGGNLKCEVIGNIHEQ